MNNHTFEPRRVTTRKPHKCFGCCLVWPKGTTMNKQAYVDLGKVHGYYLCPVCDDISRGYFQDEWECLTEGILRQGNILGWETLMHRLKVKDPRGSTLTSS